MQQKTRAVMLEEATLTTGDISTALFDTAADVVRYPLTKAEDVPLRLKGAEAAIINKTVFTAQVMDKCPTLRYIGLCATGYNNVDIKAARERGITVTNVPAYSTDAVAQHIFSFILYFSDKTAQYDAFVKDGGWQRSPTFSAFPFPTAELCGKVLGIVGFGRIGQRAAEIARAFGMKVIAATRTPREVPGVEFTDVDSVFERSDFITLNCPLTDETSRLVNARRLSLCKPSAVLINTSRGGVVDEHALAVALRDHTIAGAGLDVIEYEPMRADCELMSAPNCIITPHTSWAAVETRERLVRVAAGNLLAFVQGTPVNVVER
ncbi:MAG: D-2-hydroxyacid dehydrogenase [Oscillospiraceae bacterium]|nr:D-2-hydroxyacid dehydrogenase [Oscillospiraceae bacterium]